MEIQSKLIQVHLYKNPVESFIKSLIWFIAYCGGILAMANTNDQSVVGGAYFIFSLSLLMEFVPKIIKKTEMIARLLHLLWCVFLASALIIAVSILFGVSVPDIGYKVMALSIIVVMIYMFIDMITVWVIPVHNNKDDIVENTLNTESNEKKVEFEARLLDGALGGLREGEFDE